MTFCLAVLALSAVPVVERAMRPQELPAYPADGQVMGVNPPGFRWTPHESARSYRVVLRPGFTSEPQRSTVYPPFRKLAPGRYEWQVIYLDEQGQTFGASKPRRFEIPAGAPVLLMPDMAALEKQLSSVRPRLYLSGDRLQRVRAASWERMREAAEAALAETPYPEPAPYSGGRFTSDEWLRVFTPGKIGSAHLARTSLAYLLTRDVRYLEAARKWMMTLASWDPKGITSHGLPQPDGSIGNDEASMPMMERMAMAWDWIGDKLTAEERRQVLASMEERGNQVLRKLEADDFLSHPFNNHSGRAIAFLGQAGLAFLGDIPDARRWLDYVLRCYLTSYPAWGGDEGGWSQGISYWAFYVYNQTNFADALRQVTDVDLFRLPFYRNTGYLGLYFHPPYAPMGAFGDGGYHPPNELEGLLVDLLAGVRRDPVLKWHAREVFASGEKNETRWREWFMEDVVSTLRAADPAEVEPAGPAQLDGSRHFPDIGWVAMHSALGDARNDVWALFKSSRFGSYSHSHADQNTFQLYAYGQALAIDSGYYPSYGTPHDNLWTRQTAAHNGILVQSRGQPPFTWEAGGEITAYERRGAITLVRGEAARGYNLPQPPSLAALWNKLIGQLPPMEPRLEKFERTLAFVASPTRPALVISDALRTNAPATFDWLLHALEQMETDSRTGAVLVRSGDARLAVRVIASAPLEFSQASKFPVQPEAANNTAYVLGTPSFPDQWHLKATTSRPSREMRFLAVLAPYRAGEPEPAIERRGWGFRTESLDARVEKGKLVVQERAR